MGDSTPRSPHSSKEHKAHLPDDRNYRVLFIIFPLCALLISLFIMTTSSQRQVLPSSVRPTHYDITLTPDLEKFVFTGSEAIDIVFNDDVRQIVLNVFEVEVTAAKLQNLSLKTIQNIDAVQIEHNEKRQTVTLTFPQELAKNTKGVLKLQFNGTLNDKMCGFYRSVFVDKQGNKKYMATTQFEPTDARRAFPCWDEPAIKATFDITLIVPSNLTALSNMNVISEKQLEHAKKEVKFAKTPIMSTYLVAFVVGDLAYVEAETSGEHNGNPVLIRVYTNKGLEKQGEFALSVAVQALEYFAQLFAIPYPLPKLDMVAIPDFEAGAMENWGLVTYRTAAILFDPQASDAKFKQRIAYTVSHELAHQWFGNLVTMEWWDHLWLNEGFATWVGYLSVAKIFPEWDIWTEFLTEGVQRGLSLDALRSSHPIEVPVSNPRQVAVYFILILLHISVPIYYKGASVIRMLSSYLTEKVFLTGIQKYLKQHMYGNASTGDLWKALSLQSGIDVEKFMSIWTREVGHPVVNVTESSPDKIHVRQSRFLSTGDTKESEDTNIWWVPLGITTGPNTPEEISSAKLATREASITLPPNTDFFKLNVHQTGVFRVNYTPDRLTKLGKAVREGGLLDTSDRIGIVADAAALARSGYAKTSSFLSLVNEFENEEKYMVWAEITKNLADICNVWFEQPENVYQALQNIQRQLVSKLVTRLGWDYLEGESHQTSMLRTLVIKVAGNAGDPDVVKEAHRRFQLLTEHKNESALHPNIRGTAFEIVLTHGGGTKEFDAILQIYKEAKTEDQKVVALIALGSAQQADLIQRALEFSISDQVRSQDIHHAFLGYQSNRKARRPLWAFIKANWNKFYERYSKSMTLFGNIVRFGTQNFASEADIADIENFFKGKDTKDITRPLQQSIEKIRSNAAWLERDAKDVKDWLGSNGYLVV
ncbi:9044_t:CDS:10 [Paraglomus brasilianum]|uniref:Aminopeptidase n=1 Tax=Paraglomus brasilianum TaxID=144538 RepID=A0A9N9A527_9GLOM|nr:9044_t:CDS:10 [Paraglomus brasilianum]